MRNILIVDDERLVLTLLKRTLTEAGFRVLEAASGEQAIHIAAEFPERIEVLLTDLNMPEMDGYDVAAEVSQLRPDTKVIYMSGYFLEGTTAAKPSQCHAVLQKPFKRCTLLATIAAACEATALGGQVSGTPASFIEAHKPARPLRGFVI